MPEILHRCVDEVMGKGHDESSAYAICRSRLGLKADGSEDEMDPVLYKDNVVIAHEGKNFKNGDQEFDLTAKDMDEMVRNFTENPRQVPILFRGDHALGPDRKNRAASGWVESIKRVGKNLVARIKFIGDAAAAVANDQFRGISIGAFEWPDLHGKNVGLRLDHLLVTNAPFFPDLNIAAQSKGRAPFLYLTVEVAKMAEKQEKEVKQPAEDASVVEQLEAAQITLEANKKTIRDLMASNDNLREELEARQKNQEMELLLTDNRRKDRRIEAMRVRELVALGQSRGQFRRDEVQGFEGGDSRSDEITLAWFKNSVFEGDMKLLEFALKTREKKTLLRAYSSGTPESDQPADYTPEEQATIKAAKLDPKILAATRGAKTYTEWKERAAAAKKE